jgi:VanZ family protein
MVGESIKPTFQAWLCGAVLCGILMAGLWPFRAPQNDAHWSSNGLDFAGHGMILSSSDLPLYRAFSLEAWLQPSEADGVSAFLTLASPSNPVQLVLRQYHDLLIVQSALGRPPKMENLPMFGIRNVFRADKPVLIAVSTDTHGVSVYVNGVFAGSSPAVRVADLDSGSRLVFGGSTMADWGWYGRLRGLALYPGVLSAADASRHYEAWIKGEQRAILGADGVTARSLHIPERYHVFSKWFLQRPWQEFRPRWGYVQDVLINIAGFIPFGFLFYAYLSSMGRTKPAVATILCGFLISLTIEVLQTFLPTRDSSATDVIMNTLGTRLGVALYRIKTTRALYHECLTVVRRICPGILEPIHADTGADYV